MIRLINKNFISKASSSINIGNSSRFLFSSQKPNLNQKTKPNLNENPQKPKMKIRFGIHHPLQTMYRQKLVEDLKTHFKKQQQYKQRLKKEQKQSQNEKENQKKTNKQESSKQKEGSQDKGEQFTKWFKTNQRSLFFFGIFSYIFLFSDPSQNQNHAGDQKEGLKKLYGQLQKQVQSSKVIIKSIDTVLKQYEIYYKNYKIRVNQAELVTFLEELQKIKGGSTQVYFDTNYFRIITSTYLIKALRYLFFAGVAFVIYRLYKSGKGMNINITDAFNTKKFQPIKPENIKFTFADVAGMHEAKFQITEFVEFLKRSDKYIEMGAKVPKGALLTGPPGTGKTLLAKACAGEAGVPFYSVSGSDFVEKFSGLGAARVRKLFDEAEKNAPSIIFIDEIDAIGKKRDAGPFSNEQRDNTLNQLLVRMDGFDTKNKVIVMAATNRKDMLDPALLRPGRFDRSVEIGLPNFEQRSEILKVHLKKVKYDQKLTIEELSKKIARITPGFSGAQLANTCNQAAILAARDKLDSIPLQKFQKATERVMAGLQKRNIFSDEEKQMLAFYEAGKAVANWFTEGADPVIKISILPFSKSKAGYSHSIKDETALITKDQLLAKVCCYLAGRSSQNFFKKYISTNGNNDLERAKKIITMIVTKFGMSDSLKMHAFPDFDFTRKPYSEKVEAIIDSEINKLTMQCQNKVDQIIKSKEAQIMKVKEKLLQKETLTHNDIKQILGQRPFGGNESYKQYLKDQDEENQRVPEGPRAGVAAG